MSIRLRHTAFALSLAVALAALLGAWAAAAQAATDYRGVQLHSLRGSITDEQRTRELELTDKAGSNVIRVDVGWSTLEQKGKGQLSSSYVSKMDATVNGANSRGMKVILTVLSTPCWASSAPEDLKQGCEGSWWDRGVTQYPPTNPADYGDIVRWMTSRYGDKLAAIEVWNEPTLDGKRFWVAPDRAAAYAQLLKAAYPAAKQGDSDVAVLATLDGTDREFYAAIRDHDIEGSYDGLGAHPYGQRDFTGLKALHDLQQANGDDTPIWVTEYGWATGDGDWGVTEAEQAQNIEESYAKLDALDWVEAVVLYQLRDNGTNTSEMEDNWGVTLRDYTPKPGYVALTKAFTGAPPTDPALLPPTEEPILPPTDGTLLPPTDGTVVPPTDGTVVPPADETVVPPADDTTTPPADDTTTPPADDTSDSPADETTDPPADSTDDSGSDSSDEVTVTVVRRGNKLYAKGTAPADSDVEITLEGCDKLQDSTLTADVSGDGSYTELLGSRKKLKGCDVSAELA